MTLKKDLNREIEEVMKIETQKVFSQKKEVGFCWEIYFDYQLKSMCQNLIINKLRALLKETHNIKHKNNLSDKYIQEYIDISTEITDSLDKKIYDFKKCFLKNNNIVKVSFEDKIKDIVVFFKEKRSVNFLSLTKERQGFLLKEESEEIFEFLNLTNLQYNILCQQRSVLV